MLSQETAAWVSVFGKGFKSRAQELGVGCEERHMSVQLHGLCAGVEMASLG